MTSPSENPSPSCPPISAPTRSPIYLFVGPSIPAAVVRERVPAAIVCPPVRRGDLESLPDEAVVGMIDGVFGQDLAVSPTEILQSISRGVRIMGASSMGALRAAELVDFGMVGVGRVFEMYRNGVIEGDDEVALVFDPQSMEALSVPLVNVRYAVDRLGRPGTIDTVVGQRIVEAARRISYDERDYQLVLREAGLADDEQADKLRELLESYDLKRNDALVVLDGIEAFASRPRVAPRREPASVSAGELETGPLPTCNTNERADAPVGLWELGESVGFDELLRFTKFTGRFFDIASRALARFAIGGGKLDLDEVPPLSPADRAAVLNQRFAQLRADWGMHTADEAHETLRRLGLGLAELELTLEEDRVVAERIASLARSMPDAFAHALRGEMFANDLQLKREVARCISLRTLTSWARRAGVQPSTDARAQARALLCEMLDVAPYRAAVEALVNLGVAREDVETAVDDLARVREWSARRLASPPQPSPESWRWRPPHRPGPGRLVLGSRPKVDGSRRNTASLAFAEDQARRIGRAIGVTRVGSITRLSPLGVPAAQAFRPGTGWSSTIGGGKSTSERGAVVGALMEEVEKYAQEQFDVDEAETVTATHAEIQRRGPAVDPRELPLPNDGPYHPELAIRWFRCHDLLGDERVWVPTAMFCRRREPLDIRCGQMRGDIFFSSNGLASAFCVEQAVHHALCEIVERHATRLAQLRLLDPGHQHPELGALIDPASLPADAAALVARATEAGYRTRLLDVSACGIPVVWAMVFESFPSDGTRFGYDVRRHDGFCAHPDPVAATVGAFLEAAQTVVVNVAGAREDLVLKARSLGRHERPAMRRSAAQRALLAVNAIQRPIASVRGAAHTDVLDDLRHGMQGLQAHGVRRVLCVDYSTDTIAPARVVRVVIPGLESDNPFHTGVHAHLAHLDGLVPPHRS